jgi:FixJ family two-component response regulator
MKAGAIDFLTKPINRSELLSAIKTCEERDKTRRQSEAQRTLILQRIARLTPREREVLDYVIRGSLNKQRGFALGVHEKTIKVHRGRVFQKMGVRKVAELVRLTVGIAP